MNSAWQTLTLSTLPLQQWLNASYLHYLVGPLRQWRRGSWVMRWANEIGGALVMLVFALAPFVNNELVAVLLAACGAYWVLLTLSEDEQEIKALEADLPLAPRRPPLATPIHVLVLLYWSAVSIATAMSPVKKAAFVGWQKLTLYLLFFALVARILRSPRIRSWVIAVYLLAALAVSVYGLQQWFSGTAALATWVDPASPLSKTTRVYSYLGNPNLLAGYLIPAIAFSVAAVFVWQSWMQKALAAVMVVVNSVCLALTFSRGGWIGIVVAVGVLLLLLAHWWSIYLPRFWRRWALPIVLGSAAVVVILAMLVVEPLRDRVGSMFAGRGDSSNNFRINVWLAVIEMIKDHPIWGIGPGNVAFNKIYPLYMKARYSALSAYSILLEVILEAGIIGFTCFVWLLTVTIAQGWDAIQRLRQASDSHRDRFTNRDGLWLIAAIASLFGMIAHGLVDTVLYRPEVNTLWWLMFGIIASYYMPRQIEVGTEE
ncbi:IctB family putative bicarbonate transporter [Phormidium sp. CLA17]|uniref:IctB family putative bicarbonate transporter n=1 Tax=Leptolyngbya sp. Cla-17 TaxID=2803751 RepID=UPI0014911E32|nr:IctB family putative bicarbonate transporter [Leptolyngbya sp. Cla-17]MBM0743373.1 IctB family putative bicarbonate transporter [Leptolyngbya sp. Cla-17]